MSADDTYSHGHEREEGPLTMHTLLIAFANNDYPRTWDIGDTGAAAISIEDTRHYQLEGEEADREWDALAPGRGLIRLGEHSQLFSFSMFHQLRCLDILRKDYIYGLNETDFDLRLSDHCLNYLRQMILCRSEFTLASLLGDPDPNSFPDIYMCRNWETVYAAVRLNQEHN